MKKKGFTLIELLVVIAIIGLLATLAVISLGSARKDARDAKRQADMRTLQSAVELYINDTGSVPSSASWTVLSTDLADYLAGDAPQPPTGGTICSGSTGTWNANYCYFYCSDTTNQDYLMGAKLESADEIAGDIDDNVAYAFAGCIAETTNSGGSADLAGASAAFPALGCDDGVDGGAVFCLGT